MDGRQFPEFIALKRENQRLIQQLQSVQASQRKTLGLTNRAAVGTRSMSKLPAKLR